MSIGGEDDLVIKLKIDNANAMAGQKAVGREFDRTTAKADAAARKMADAQEKAAKKAADAQKKAAESSFVSLQSVQSAGIKFAGDVAEAAEKAASRQAAAAKRAADASAREAKKAADAQAAAAKKSFDQQFVSLGSLQRAAIKHHDKVTDAAKKAADDQAQAAAAPIDSIKALGLAYASLGTARKVLDYFYERFHAMRADLLENVKEMENIRKGVLQLAALNDRLGNTTREAKESLLFRGQTLQSRQAATEFQEAAIGAGESTVKDETGKGIISREEFDKLMLMAGKFQAAEGGAAETHGTLAGMLPMLMGKEGVTGAEAFRKEQQLYGILKPGGTTFTSGMDQLLKLAPLVTSGLYKDVADPTALLSAFSLSNKFGAGENVQQFTRATVGGIGKMRGVKLEGDSEKVGEYLRGLGATTQMDPIEIGKRISADLAREEREATARGEEANLYNYLMYHGYGAQEERMALLGFHGLQKTGQFQNIFEPLAKTPPPIDRATGETAADRKIREFQATSPTAAAMRNQVAADLSAAARGAGAPEYYQQLKEIAAERLLARKEIYGEGKHGKELVEYWESGMLNYMTGTGSAQIAEEAAKILEEQAKASGVDTTKEGFVEDTEGHAVATRVRALGYDHWGESEDERARKFYEFAGQIGAARGNPNAGIDQLIGLMRKSLEVAERQEKLMREGQKLPVGPLAPARPGPGWTR